MKKPYKSLSCITQSKSHSGELIQTERVVSGRETIVVREKFGIITILPNKDKEVKGSVRHFLFKSTNNPNFLRKSAPIIAFETFAIINVTKNY
ncbi:UNVERIFIED_CONTAM: hypothetical protein NCL1_36274 [Trichonephila clavipes]